MTGLEGFKRAPAAAEGPEPGASGADEAEPLHVYPEQLDAGVVEELHETFHYHRPTENQAARHARLSEFYTALAAEIKLMTPNSREQSLALTHSNVEDVHRPGRHRRREPRAQFAGHPLAVTA